ncbi:hypothetical protein [Paenibacillus sp. P3E]|nr:hypothetical protein [Paenibacillus sp. P3E]
MEKVNLILTTLAPLQVQVEKVNLFLAVYTLTGEFAQIMQVE